MLTSLHAFRFFGQCTSPERRGLYWDHDDSRIIAKEGRHGKEVSPAFLETAGETSGLEGYACHETVIE